MTYRKKLIEVALPLDAINQACKPETENPFLKGHPRSIHVYWARAPLVACRAIIFCSLVDDPEQDGLSQEFLKEIDRLPPPDTASIESAGGSTRRAKLFSHVSELVKWESTTDERILATARMLIRSATSDNPPPLLDPFSGRGSIPIEGQRLGLESHGSDLNPVATLITKVLIEIPPKFAGRPPVNPDAQQQIGNDVTWKGAAGLASDVRWYGRWMQNRAWERIGHLYPKGPNGETVIAWLWARTVRCPNPACGAQMPLVRSFWLSKKRGKETWLEPVINAPTKSVAFRVRNGSARPDINLDAGTKSGRADFRCTVCRQSAGGNHIKAEGMAGRLGHQLLAVVAEGNRSRVYLSPDDANTVVLSSEEFQLVEQMRSGPMSGATPERLTGGTCYGYGLTTWGSLFTPRQLVALTTFSDLVTEARELVLQHSGDQEYADAVVTYLGCAISRLVDYHSTLCTWNPTNENISHVFVRQALPLSLRF